MNAICVGKYAPMTVWNSRHMIRPDISSATATAAAAAQTRVFHYRVSDSTRSSDFVVVHLSRSCTAALSPPSQLYRQQNRSYFSFGRGHKQQQQQPYHQPAQQELIGLSSSRSYHQHRSYSNTCFVNGSGERHGTTIICVRKNGKVCMIGDSMVSQGNMIVKPNAIKIRKIMPKGSMVTTRNDDDDQDKDKDELSLKNNATLVGFAGSTADAFTLMERLENKLDEYPGQLLRSCVELAKGWRTDKYLRRLDAALLVANSYHNFELTGNGDVLDTHDGILGIGSGSPYAIAAARALIDIPELSAEDVARKAMNVASDMCVFTNKQFTIEILDAKIEEAEEVETKRD